MASEVTQLYLMDAELYGTSGREDGKGQEDTLGSATHAIDGLLRGHIFPTIPKLLQDEDPMPLYALKVRERDRGTPKAPEYERKHQFLLACHLLPP